MTYVLHLSPSIAGDVMAAAGYYTDIDPNLGLSFVDELERTLLLIQAYPLVGRILYDDVRRT